MHRKPPFSGPITTPRSQESAAIQAAPAYDRAKAAALIPDMPAIRVLIDDIREADPENAPAFGKTRSTDANGHALHVFGPCAPSASARARVETEIRKLSEGNHKVSLLLVDLCTQSGLSYCSSLPMCAQSTVKAIYAGALLDQNPAALQENGQYLHDAIVFSSNEAYEALWNLYGEKPLERWCREAGVDADFAQAPYPRTYTARDMGKLWTRLYAFLNSGAEAARQFAPYYADTGASAARKQLGGRCPVQTKAGWECGLNEAHNYDPYAQIPARFTDGDPANDECAANDTGIVYTGKGPYLFVLYTDHPFGIFRDYAMPNPLYDITEALYGLQQTLQPVQ